MNGFIIVPILIPFLLVAFALSEILMRRFQRFQPVEWEAKGKPCGIFSAPTTFRSDVAGKSMVIAWVFHTPTWMKQQEDKTILCLWVYRIAVLIWNLGIIYLIVENT